MTKYITLENNKDLCNFKRKPTFVLPSEYSFYINEKINPLMFQLYNEIYKRNFKIKGIEVVFQINRKEDESVEAEIYKIKHEQFEITKGTMKYHERHLDFYEDSSSTTLYTYVGDTWEDDRAHFFNNYKMHNKLDGLEKKYLQYSTSSHGQGNFKIDTDLGRNYDAEGDEPITISKESEINKLKNFLLGLIEEIKQIPEQPIDSTLFDYTKKKLDKSLILKSFYHSFNGLDLNNIELIQNNRLIRLGSPIDLNKKYNSIYHDGYVYAEEDLSITKPVNSTNYTTIYKKETYEIEIELLYSDNIYVIDLEPSENLLRSFKSNSKFNLFGDSKKEDTNTDKDLMYNNSVVSKLVDLEDYDGTYTKPLYLIGRRIYSDEIKTCKLCQF